MKTSALLLILSATIAVAGKPTVIEVPSKTQPAAAKETKAEALPSKGVPKIVVIPAETGGQATPVKVTMTLDKLSYQEGEYPILKVKPDKDCYLYLYYRDANYATHRSAVQLFPNSLLAENKAKGGQEIQLMPAPHPTLKGRRVALEVSGPPFGNEYFVLIATEQPAAVVAAVPAKGAAADASPYHKAIEVAEKLGDAVLATAPLAGKGMMTAVSEDGVLKIAISTTAKK